MNLKTTASWSFKEMFEATKTLHIIQRNTTEEKAKTQQTQQWQRP